jgi:AraC-like DNA-binding protein
MKIEIIKPKNETLKKFIDCFYILTHSKKDSKTTYFTFPSIFSIVTICSNIKLSRTSNKLEVSQSLDQNFISDIETKFNEPLLIQYEGEIKEVTIYFKPLGLSAFLDKPLSNYSSEKNNIFTPFKDYNETMKSILELESRDKMIDMLEKYWLTKHKGHQNFKLENSMNDIIKNPDISISLIAKNNNINHKTLISHFKKHTGKTPTEFRKIVRFRKALQNKKNKNLTEVSYFANYFDQAHMIKDFKSLTGYKPKSFFKNLSTVEGKVNWVFI